MKKDVTQVEVQFDKPEADARYSLYVQPSWLTTAAISRKTEKGVVVTFATAAPDAATIDWVLIR